MRRSSVVTVVVLILAVSGCYHYVPEAGRTLAQGTPVRIRLEHPRSFELPSLTAHNIQVVTAEMVEGQDGEVVVSTTWLDAATGEGFPGENWTFRIPRENIAALEVRTLSRWRTAAVFVMGFLATYAGWDALRGSDAGGGEPGNGGNTR